MKHLLSFSSPKHLQKCLTVSPWNLPTGCFPTGKGLFWHWERRSCECRVGDGGRLDGTGGARCRDQPQSGSTACGCSALSYQTLPNIFLSKLHGQAEEGEKWDYETLSVCTWKLPQVCPEQKPVCGNGADAGCMNRSRSLAGSGTGLYRALINTGLEMDELFTKMTTVLKLCSSFIFNPKCQFSSLRLRFGDIFCPPPWLRALPCSHSHIRMRCFPSQNQLVHGFGSMLQQQGLRQQNQPRLCHRHSARPRRGCPYTSLGISGGTSHRGPAVLLQTAGSESGGGWREGRRVVATPFSIISTTLWTCKVCWILFIFHFMGFFQCLFPHD